VVDRESQNMSHRLEQIASEFGDSLRSHWPLDDVLGVDVIAAAQRRLEERLKLPSKTEEVEEGLWIKADSFSLVFAIAFLATRNRYSRQKGD
jgi:DNA polymerase-3 subunit epsilon